MADDSRFRFPREIRRLFKFMIEDQAGHQGEIGESFLQTLERAIHDNTHYKSGKDAFGGENYPYVAPRHLLMFGRLWLTNAIDRAFQDSNALKDLSIFKLERTAQILEDAAKRCRELDKLIEEEKKKEKK